MKLDLWEFCARDSIDSIKSNIESNIESGIESKSDSIESSAKFAAKISADSIDSIESNIESGIESKSDSIESKTKIAPFRFITDDSRQAPQNTAFLKTPGNEKFIESAKKAGFSEFLEVSDLRNFLDLNLKIIGITGTNGKTTTAAMIYSILLDLGYKCALLGTRGFFVNEEQLAPKGLTTPSTLEIYYNIAQARARGCEFFVMEVSSHAIAQNRIAGLNFALRILTNITSDHLDFHGSLENYIATKNSFFHNTNSLCLINKDESNAEFNKIDSMAASQESAQSACFPASLETAPAACFPASLETAPAACFQGNFALESKTTNAANIRTYGIVNPGTFSIESYSLKNGILAQVLCGAERAELNLDLFGLYNLYNALAAISAVKLLELKAKNIESRFNENNTKNINLAEICKALSGFGGVKGRMQIVNKNPLIIVDFAHTEDGMRKVFEAFLGWKISVVFGAGGDRDRSKRPKMGAIAAKFARKIYITSDNPRSENKEFIIQEILSGLKPGDFDKKHIVVEADRKAAIALAVRELENNEVLLVLGKGDENYQIIGNEKLHFDDCEEIESALKNLQNL